MPSLHRRPLPKANRLRTTTCAAPPISARRPPMLIEPLIAQLNELRLAGMARTLEQLAPHGAFQQLSFEERLAQLLQSELAYRQNQRLVQRLRWAKLPQSATAEDLDLRTPRGLDKRVVTKLITLDWLDSRLNV